MSTENRNRVQKGVSTGGQFATEARPEAAGIALSGASETTPEFLSSEEFEVATPERRQEMVDAMKAFMPEKTDLCYIAYDDQLSDEQIGMVLAGNGDGAYDDYLEGAEDYHHDRAREEFIGAFNEANEKGLTDIDWSELSQEEEDDFKNLMLERDRSDPIADLTQNTRPQLMRTRLSTPGNDPALGEAWSGHALYGSEETDATRALVQTRRNIVGAALTKHGIDVTTPENQDAIKSLVEEGPYNWHEGVDLDVIFQADVSDVAVHPDGPSKLSFANPHVLLIDRVNGSGYDAQFTGSIDKELPAAEEAEDSESRVYLDKGGVNGYGWDEVAGLVKSAYKTEISRETPAHALSMEGI